MAKALFHKSQRVYVKPVGTWATIESVVPHWVKDVDEPLRITYDCALGRPFQAQELVSEQQMHNQERAGEDEDDFLFEHWQIRRRNARWRAGAFGEKGTNVGTYPMVITDEGSWSGWRVSGREYDRDPERIEHEARMIANTPDLLRVARKIAEFASEHPDQFPKELEPVARRCATVLRYIYRLEDEKSVEAAETAAA
jgi:hypothetical protein